MAGLHARCRGRRCAIWAPPPTLSNKIHRSSETDLYDSSSTLFLRAHPSTPCLRETSTLTNTALIRMPSSPQGAIVSRSADMPASPPAHPHALPPRPAPPQPPPASAPHSHPHPPSGVLLLDGGCGHLLKGSVKGLVPGLPFDSLFFAGALANVVAPEAVQDVHRQYIAAGGCWR